MAWEAEVDVVNIKGKVKAGVVTVSGKIMEVVEEVTGKAVKGKEPQAAVKDQLHHQVMRRISTNTKMTLQQRVQVQVQCIQIRTLPVIWPLPDVLSEPSTCMLVMRISSSYRCLKATINSHIALRDLFTQLGALTGSGVEIGIKLLTILPQVIL